MLKILIDTIKSWSSNHPMTHSAAAAYFAVFSLPGLLIIVISIATFFMDEQIVRNQIQDYVGNFFGQGIADTISNIIDNARLNSSGLKTLIIGGGILFFGSTGLFNQLKTSFNAVWGLETKPEKTILRMFANRAVSLGVAVMVGFLLLMSMVMSAGLKILGNWVTSEFPELGFLSRIEFTMTFLTISVLFTMIFKILPDVRIHLKYAFAGGVLSALLFVFGEWGFAKALDTFFPRTVFGAAGSIVLIMVWVTYGCMILQFGAEFIKAMMRHNKVPVKTTRFVKPFEFK